MRQQNGKVRLADIAAEVGVSVMSVASVVNSAGKNSVKVSEATARRILEACKRLNYQPNMNARALRGTPLKLIGVLVDSQAGQAVRLLVSELERVTAAEGYLLLVAQAHDNIEQLYKAYQVLLQHGVSGVICLSHDYPNGHDELEKYFGNAEKIVFLADPGLEGQPFVALDRISAVSAAVSAMRENGSDRIGLCIADDNLNYSVAVVEGYRKGLACLPEYIYRYTPPFCDAAAIERLMCGMIDGFILPNGLNGIIGMNDYCIAALLQQLTGRGIRVPGEIQLCGYDNELFCNFTVPALSSISGNIRGRADALLRTLLELLEGKKPEKLIVKAEFIPRGSMRNV